MAKDKLEINVTRLTKLLKSMQHVARKQGDDDVSGAAGQVLDALDDETLMAGVAEDIATDFDEELVLDQETD